MWDPTPTSTQTLMAELTPTSGPSHMLLSLEYSSSMSLPGCPSSSCNLSSNVTPTYLGSAHHRHRPQAPVIPGSGCVGVRQARPQKVPPGPFLSRHPSGLPIHWAENAVSAPCCLAPWVEGCTSLLWGRGDKGRLTRGSPQLISVNTMAGGLSSTLPFTFLLNHTGKLETLLLSPVFNSFPALQ